MENRFSLAALLFLALVSLGLTAVSPRPVVVPQQSSVLGQLETRLAVDPNDALNTARLAAAYLELQRPQLAIALIRSVGTGLREDPMLSHQLARAYEAEGRITDALATAALAEARCARAIGSGDVFHTTRVPTHACSERTLAGLERHRNALAHMHNWDVQSPRDPRTALAYRIAERRVSLASYNTP